MATDANPHILERLSGCRNALMGIYDSGTPMSSDSKGTEREVFVRKFLEQILPPPFRFGTGEITDLAGQISGQVDVVVEFPFLPSFPAFLSDSPRLYLADGVAAASEIKSDLAKQWKAVLKTSQLVGALRRDVSALQAQTIERMSTAATPRPSNRARVPFIAVGYRGWSTPELLRERVEQATGLIDAALVIDSEIFVSHPEGELAGMPAATQAYAFWAFLSAIQQAARYVLDTGVRLSDYLMPNASRIPSFSEPRRMSRQSDDVKTFPANKGVDSDAP